jgi:hypothetical protein
MSIMRALPNVQKPPCPASNPSCVRLVTMMVFSAMTTVIPVQRCVAQLLFGDPHFAIQPHAAATRTTNPGAGEYPLDSTPNAIVSVPPACAVAKRCPLLVQLRGAELGTITSSSTLAKNLVFLPTHPEEMKALTRAGIGDPSKSARLDDCCTDPAQVDQMGPLGIWRTP